MNKFFLITTPILETWDFNKDTLMLGDWCNSFEKNDDLKKLKKNKILDYHWKNTEKVSQDYVYLNDFAEKILVKLVEKLNFIHDTNFSKEYWRIIIGNWLFS